jgi:hypothetical protein
MDNAIRGLELFLRRALEATAADFVRWEDDLGPRFEEQGFDESTLPRRLIEQLPLDDKLA